MKPSDDLFQLIKVLEGTEKQRYKRYCKAGHAHVQQVHVQLFDDLNGLDNYDEAAFLNRFGDRPYAVRLAFYKNYLYGHLLDGLRSMRHRSGVEKPMEYQIREWLEDAHYLRGKLLFDQSLRRLEKARKAAEKYEYHEVLLETLRLLRTHWMERQGQRYAERVVELLQVIRALSAMIDLKARYMELRDLLFLRQRHVRGAVKDLEEAEIDALIGEGVPRHWPHPCSSEVEYNLLMARALALQMGGDHEGAWECHRLAYVLWRNREHFRVVRQGQYLKVLNNYLTVSSYVQRYVDFEVALGELEAGEVQSADGRAEALQNVVFIRLQWYLSVGNWEGAKELEVVFLKGRAVMGPKLGRQRILAYYLSFARLYLILGDGDKVLRYCSHCMRERDKGGLGPRHGEAMLLRALVYFERAIGMGERWLVLAERSLRGLRESPAAGGAGNGYLTVVAKGLEKLLNHRGMQVSKARYQGLLEALREMKGVCMGEGYGFVVDWVESKVAGMPLYIYLDKGGEGMASG